MVDPYGRDVGVAWKAAAVAPMVRDALDSGRKVVWIEDFNGNLPTICGVEFIDSGEIGVVRAEDLPRWAVTP